MRSLVLVVVISGTAAAQAPGEQPLPAPAPIVGAKNPLAARLVSAGAMAAGLVVINLGFVTERETAMVVGLGGALIGPSVGRWYAGESGAETLVLRAVGGLAFACGALFTLEYAGCGVHELHDPVSDGEALMVAGVGVWLTTSIYDIAMASRDATQWNERNRHTLQITPTVAMSGQRTTGFAIGMRF